MKNFEFGDGTIGLQKVGLSSDTITYDGHAETQASLSQIKKIELKDAGMGSTNLLKICITFTNEKGKDKIFPGMMLISGIEGEATDHSFFEFLHELRTLLPSVPFTDSRKTAFKKDGENLHVELPYITFWAGYNAISMGGTGRIMMYIMSSIMCLMILPLPFMIWQMLKGYKLTASANELKFQNALIPKTLEYGQIQSVQPEIFTVSLKQHGTTTSKLYLINFYVEDKSGKKHKITTRYQEANHLIDHLKKYNILDQSADQYKIAHLDGGNVQSAA